MKPYFIIFVVLILASCSMITEDKHLGEKTFKSGDVTVKWYHTSEITTVHDFVDIERWGWTKTILEANTGGIHDILINGDTITIQATKDLLIYNLAAITLNSYVKLDTSITNCEYMKKHDPKNAKYYCDSASIDTINPN